MAYKTHRAEFSRIEAAPTWRPGPDQELLRVRGGRGWQSNGGIGRLHPARGFPYSLEVPLPETPGRLTRVGIVGVLALFADPAVEPPGSIGGALALAGGEAVVSRVNLVQGRHYSDAARLEPVERVNGDGTEVRSVGQTLADGVPVRVDALWWDVPSVEGATTLVLRTFATPASFVVFDLVFECDERPVCPFRGQGDRISLAEIGQILRLRDRARFDRALLQASESVRQAEDPDEARSLALTFLAVVAAALMGPDAPRALHSAQVEAARKMLALEDRGAIAAAMDDRARAMTAPVLPRWPQSHDGLIDRALGLLERNFARDLQDEEVANSLGLSTSHFRYLFKQATHQPFRKYVVGLRLEKARELLLSTDQSVTEVAQSVGFTSPAHFTRAFAKRFGEAPSAVRTRGR